MAVRSEELKQDDLDNRWKEDAQRLKGRRAPTFSGNKAVAVVSWLVGVALTWLGLSVFMPGATWIFPAAIALGTQTFLTVMQRSIWKGKISYLSLLALAFDVLLNAGGIFPYAMRLGETPTAQMFITAFGGSRQVGPITAMIVSAVLGLLIAAAPEELWNRKD